MLERVMDTVPGSERWYIGGEPVGGMGTPEKIAEEVAWLLSDAASFVTSHPIGSMGLGRTLANS
jgi:hypothetical protein